MAVDPTDPWSVEELLAAEDTADVNARDDETPEADAAEQWAEVTADTAEGETSLDGETTVEADPADVAEQARVVELDEEEDAR